MTDSDYKTPKERIGDDFRKSLDASSSVFSQSKSNAHNGCDIQRSRCTRSGRGTFPENVQKEPSLAMIYSPCQAFEDIYDVCTALNSGTLFASLEFPFEAARCATCRRTGGR